MTPEDGRRETARFVGDVELGEAWMVGTVMFVLPAIPDGATPALKSALARRRQATLSGRCECGATMTRAWDRAWMEHEDSCDATDESILRLIHSDGT